MMTSTNPLLSDWSTPYEVPPFDLIEDQHYRPAFEKALAEHEKEIEAIAENADLPTFQNTIEALELSFRVFCWSL